jgi:hydroxymethylbilane synthase
MLDYPLSKLGGKGLFVKELELALLEGRADCAVHSVKDVPTDLPSSFELCAILERTEPRDAVVLSKRYATWAALPADGVVGTSSLRRESQLRARYPHLTIRPLRGNVETRLAKLDHDEQGARYDAIILAAVGLQRLGLAARIHAMLEVEESLPAVGQGALGIEIRSDRHDVRDWLRPLASIHTTACIHAERAVARALGGACHVPLAAYAKIEANGTLWLRALVASKAGDRIVRAEGRDAWATADRLGASVAQRLKQDGAADILAQLQPS